MPLEYLLDWVFEGFFNYKSRAWTRLVHPGTFTRIVFLLCNNLLSGSVCCTLCTTATNIFPVDPFVGGFVKILLHSSCVHSFINWSSRGLLLEINLYSLIATNLLWSFDMFVFIQRIYAGLSLGIPLAKMDNWIVLCLSLRPNLPPLEQTSKELFAPFLLSLTKTKGKVCPVHIGNVAQCKCIMFPFL